jgi:hypothetical protein
MRWVFSFLLQRASEFSLGDLREYLTFGPIALGATFCGALATRGQALAPCAAARSHMNESKCVSLDICELSADEVQSLPLVGRVGKTKSPSKVLGNCHGYNADYKSGYSIQLRVTVYTTAPNAAA